jgi:hypothetical protein
MSRFSDRPARGWGCARSVWQGWWRWPASAAPPGQTAIPRDPFETYNRGMFAFNDGVDRAIFKPAATMYRAVTPHRCAPASAISFGNLEDVWSFVNSLLQGKAAGGGADLCALQRQYLPRPGRRAGYRQRARIDRQREDSARHWATGACPAVLTWCCRFWGHRPCVTRWPCRSTWQPTSWATSTMCRHRNSIKVVDLLDTRAACCAPATHSTKLRWTSTVSRGMHSCSAGAMRCTMAIRRTRAAEPRR